MVRCNTCKREYEPMKGCEDTEQAYRCSATVFLREGKYYLVGHYGSTVVDMEMHELTADSDTDFELGVICDDCIEKLIDQKKTKKVQSGLW